MRHASLFSGIGGFDLAAQWMGWDNVFQCEINEYCNKILEKNFPNVKRHKDITTTDFTIYGGGVDILSGGFPCQPYSVSGKLLGKNDDRALWFQMLRAIREIGPTFVVGENVLGLHNKFPVEFEEICNDLEINGYKVQPFVIPAIAIGANHKRDRIWFIAHSTSLRLEGSFQKNAGNQELHERRSSGAFNADIGWEGYDLQRDDEHLRRDNGVPNWVDRIKSVGNAIIPQIAFEIFKAIEKINNDLTRQIYQIPSI